MVGVKVRATLVDALEEMSIEENVELYTQPAQSPGFIDNHLILDICFASPTPTVQYSTVQYKQLLLHNYMHCTVQPDLTDDWRTEF